MTWLKRVKKSLRSDELFGKWDTDDATGFGIMMGAWIEFKPNGTGSFESWENSDNGYEFKGDFKWERIGDKKI